MDNSISQTIIQPSTSLTSSESNGFFDNLKQMSATTWLLIILILAFLGFNIFAYLSQITQAITDLLKPLIGTTVGTTVAVTGNVVDVSAEGAKAVVSGASGAVESGLTAVQNITPNQAPSMVKGQPVTEQKIDQTQQSTLNKALNNSNQQQNEYQPHEASSSVNTSGKSGWCYVGEDRGFRTCAQVGVDDICMSGDIFPSQEICMNPNLRA